MLHSNKPIIRLKRTLVAVIDGSHVSFLEKPLMRKFAFLPAFCRAHGGMDIEHAKRYLESAFACNKFDTLMLVGDAEDLRRFRSSLREDLRKRVVTEVQRPNQHSEFLTERLQEMCA